MSPRIAWKGLSGLALIVLSVVPPAAARIETATVIVEGMACPFCAFGIEKRLKRIEGVGSIDVSLAESSASMSAADGGSIDIAGIPEAIRKAGFTPGTIEVTAIGTINADDRKRPLLEVSGSDEQLLLVNLSEGIEQKITEYAAAGVSVRVSGALHIHPEELPGLEAVKVEAE